MKKSLLRLVQSPVAGIALIFVLVLATTLPGIGDSELFVNGDEARHAMTGVFFRDMMADLPLGNPVEYTETYYAHYPALGVVHWPPLFHLVEGVFFGVLGVSVLVARLCVLAFALLLASYFYALVRDLFGAPAALVASMLLASTTAVVYYSRVVMLEVPSLALCVAAVFHFHRYLADRGRKHIWLALGWLALAALTRQHALLLGPLFVCIALVLRRGKMLLRREVILATLATLALVVPYYLYTIHQHGGSVANDALTGARGSAFLASLDNLTYYLRHLPKQAGFAIPAVAAISILIALIARNKPSRVFIVWIALCYAMFTAVAQKDSRYVIYWLPPICAMAAYGVREVERRMRLRWAVRGIVIGVTVYASIAGIGVERQYVRGCAQTAQTISFLNGKNPIFFQGELNGSFIFHTRVGDSERRSLVMRGSKMLYVTNILKAYGSEQRITTQEELLVAFDRNAIRFAVVEDRNILGAPNYDLLMKTLESGPFRELKTVQVESNVLRFAGLHLRIFEYKDAKYPERLTVRLPMLTLANGIEVKVW